MSVINTIVVRARAGIAFSALCSLALVVFGSPLFRTLGFEYSALSALALSIAIPFSISTHAVGRASNFVLLLTESAAETLLYILTPLLVSLASVPFIRNCALGDGLVFYTQIVTPTALIAMLIGMAVGIRPMLTRKRTMILFALWLLSILPGFVGGYTGPQIFTFGWQYGFFPGFVWDEAMELRSGYWLTRAFQLAFATAMLLSAPTIGRSLLVQVLRPLAISTVIVLIVLLGHDGDGRHAIFGPSQTEILQQTDTLGSIRLRYSSHFLNLDERLVILRRASMDLDSICVFFGIPHPTEPITIYVYRSVDQMDSVVGTRNASISKPWQSSLHIAIENIHSLKHELTHVVLGPYGRPPFDVSYSTGLTEGAAEAADPEFDGIRSLDELAAAIIDLKLARGVSDVMSFTGFASNASAKSYVLAGSFSSYLVKRYGTKKYLDVYHSLDYAAAYGRTLEQLEREWLASLSQPRKRPGPDDSLRLRYYFDRRSIIAEPCLRRIGKMMKLARELVAIHHDSLAACIYERVVGESGRVDALQARVACLMRQRLYQEALAVLDTTHTSSPELKPLGLHILRGDLLLLCGRGLDSARAEWNQAFWLRLNAEQVLTAGSRLYCLGRSADQQRSRLFLQKAYAGESADSLVEIVSSLRSSTEGELTFEAVKNYMLSRLEGARGDILQQSKLLSEAAAFGRATTLLTNDDPTCIFFRLIDERATELRRALGQPDLAPSLPYYRDSTVERGVKVARE